MLVPTSRFLYTIPVYVFPAFSYLYDDYYNAVHIL